MRSLRLKRKRTPPARRPPPAPRCARRRARSQKPQKLHRPLVNQEIVVLARSDLTPSVPAQREADEVGRVCGGDFNHPTAEDHIPQLIAYSLSRRGSKCRGPLTTAASDAVAKSAIDS
ncbi:hypothetical protein EVAR_36446_1 [Eumeta japonica]|uniref:Uncharacterized protein n=1 Tax=Eumeta variegata TaxID=151549 RepID=A0A4C1VQ94_EUMVA|nr:hypothetical protein EVAR_36446_1 [Eumeta japonica]